MQTITKRLLSLSIFFAAGSAFADCPELDAGQLQTMGKPELTSLWCKYMDERNLYLLPRMRALGEGRQTNKPVTKEMQQAFDAEAACNNGATKALKAFRATTKIFWPNCMEDKDYAEKANRELLEKKASELSLERLGRFIDYGRAYVEPKTAVVVVKSLDHTAGQGGLNKWEPTGANTDKILRVLCANKVAQELFQQGASFMFIFYNEAPTLIGSIPVKAKDCE